MQSLSKILAFLFCAQCCFGATIVVHPQTIPIATAGGSASAFTLVQSASTTDGTAPALTGVTAGNLIVYYSSYEGGNGFASVSDGTSSLTLRSVCQSSGSSAVEGQFAYLLSANGGNKTYTPTFNLTPAFRGFDIVMEFSAGGTKAFDTDIITGHGTTGTALTTGNVTTSGSFNLVLVGFGSYGQTISSETIGGSAATMLPASQPANKSWLFYRMTGLTAQGGAATGSANDNWVLPLIAFKTS